MGEARTIPASAEGITPGWPRDVMPDLAKRSLKALDAFFQGSRTICQGDYRADNLFCGEPGSDRELVACDWQAPTFSPGLQARLWTREGECT